MLFSLLFILITRYTVDKYKSVICNNERKECEAIFDYNKSETKYFYNERLNMWYVQDNTDNETDNNWYDI